MKSENMTPRLIGNYSTHIVSPYSERLCNRLVSDSASMLLPDFSYFTLRKFAVRMAVPFQHAFRLKKRMMICSGFQLAFLDGVARVFFDGAKIKVHRIYAAWIVAARTIMKNPHSFWNLTSMNHPRNSVGKKAGAQRPSLFDLAVSGFESVASPEPTRAGFVHLVPKALLQRFSSCRTETRLPFFIIYRSSVGGIISAGVNHIYSMVSRLVNAARNNGRRLRFEIITQVGCVKAFHAETLPVNGARPIVGLGWDYNIDSFFK